MSRRGRPAKTLAELQLTGQYRADRHGHLLTLPAPMPRSPVPDAVVTGLEARGVAFVQAVWAAYTGWNPLSETLLHEAGMLVDELEQLRGQKGERAAQRLLLSALSALRLED